MKNTILVIASVAILPSSASAQLVQTGGTELVDLTSTYRNWNPTKLLSDHGITYDIDVNGPATFAGLDMSDFHADFAGVTYSVSIADTNGAALSKFNTTTANITGVSIAFTFSEGIDVSRSMTNAYNSGEGEGLTGVDYFYFEDSVDPNLTISGNLDWINNTAGTIVALSGSPSKAQSYDVTNVTSYHNGIANNNWILGMRLTAVPEPSSTALLGFGALGVLLRRKR